MKSKEVLSLLKITRQTLTSYVKSGKVRVERLPNTFYEYDDEDVYKLFNSELQRKTVVYCRVSTQSQKKSLESQKEYIQNFCNSRGIGIDTVYSEVGSGVSFERKQFQNLLFDILDRKVKLLIISHKDRLIRLSFEIFEKLFNKFGTEVVVVSKESLETENEDKEIFEDIISVLHTFSMRVYSKRRRKKLELMVEDLKND